MSAVDRQTHDPDSLAGPGVRSKRKVLLVGAFPEHISANVRGGQLSLCNAIVDSPLASEFELLTLDTTQKSIPAPPLSTRTATASKRLVHLRRVLKDDGISGVVVMSSSGSSCIEKGLMVGMARRKGIGAAFYLVSTRVFDDAEKSRFWRWWLRRVTGWSDLLMCQGKTMVQRYRDLTGSTQLECAITPSLVDLSGWEASRLPRTSTSGQTTIVFSGWIHRDKGVFDLIEAVAGSELLRRQKVVLYGKGHHFDELQRLVQSLGIERTVELVGWVDHDDLQRRLSQADIFVLPSHSEGLPMSLIEALASSTAAITTPVGAVPDYLTDGEHALFVPPSNPLALRTALERLVGDHDLRAKLSEAGSRLARKTFDASVAFRPFSDCFERLCEITAWRRDENHQAGAGSPRRIGNYPSSSD